MTSTNQAFIKAYRTDQAQAAPASPPLGTAGRPHTPPAGAAAPRATTVASTAGERSAIYGPRPHRSNAQPLAETNTMPLVVPSTSIANSADYRQIRTEQPARPNTARWENSGQQAADSRTPRPLSAHGPQRGAANQEKRPLSSFIASTGIARLDTEPAEVDFFRPGTTLASFHWPEVCRALLRQGGQSWNRLADLLESHAAAGRSLVGIIAMTPGRGASTTALCLAARLAERRRRVVVVDANFRNPQLAQWLEVEPTAGWQDVLKHGAPLTDAVARATDDHLDLLALGDKVPTDAMRLVAGLQAVVTAGVLRHAYEHVLLDAGAFLDSASQPIVLELMRNMGVDAAIAITGPRSARTNEVETLAEHLGRSGCELLGTIENRSTRQTPGVESREPEITFGP